MGFDDQLSIGNYDENKSDASSEIGIDFIKSVVSNKLDISNSFNFEGGEIEEQNVLIGHPFNIDSP